MSEVLRMFAEEGLGLRFTSETPKEDKIQLLDTLVDVKEDHVCWMHNPRSTKKLLDYRSAHSKLVKNGIAYSCLQSALTKTCFHKMKECISAQVARLRNSNFPDSVITSACDKVIRYIKVDSRNPDKEKAKIDKKNVAVIPYIHRLSRGLMGVASRYGVNVIVFSVRNKLRRIINVVKKRADRKSKPELFGCRVKHGMKLGSCAQGTVYKIPFSCGHSYIGQTGRNCLNIRLREHHSSLKSTLLI